jgi:hypothetical protein
MGYIDFDAGAERRLFCRYDDGLDGDFIEEQWQYVSEDPESDDSDFDDDDNKTPRVNWHTPDELDLEDDDDEEDDEDEEDDAEEDEEDGPFAYDDEDEWDDGDFEDDKDYIEEWFTKDDDKNVDDA